MPTARFTATMSGTVDSTSAGNNLSTTRNTDAFPQYPGEDFLAHAGTQYMERVDARLADENLLSVARGNEPEACKAILDVDLSTIPLPDPSHNRTTGA